MILAKVYQKFLAKCKIRVSQAQRNVIFTHCLLQNVFLMYSPYCTIPDSKILIFLASEGGTSSSDTPVCKIGAEEPPNHPPPCQRQIYALVAMWAIFTA